MTELNRGSRVAGPQTVARHGRLRKPGPVGTVLAFIAAALAVVLVSGAAVAGIVTVQTFNQIKPEDIPIDSEGPPPGIGAYPNGFNMLIVGSDKCESDDGCDGRGSANLNDVTMLLHVSADGTNATAVSFPRDLVVPIPSCPKADGSGNNSAMAGRPINETLFYGGLACTVLTVQELTGLEIQFAGLITFNGVIKMTNAVGGVEVCVTDDIDDPNVGLHIKKGKTTLKGREALAFLRTRHGVGNGGDLTRISSQQVYLSSLVRTLKSADTLSDPAKVYALAQAATTSMTLSKGLRQLDTMASIALRLKDVPLERITFVQFPGVTGQGGLYEGKVAPVQSKADKLFALLKADKPFKLATVADGEPGGGSVVDPDAPASTPDPAVTDEPTDTIDSKGQTAADYTCSVAK
jgi:LCP family protein required for cell wall assembly